MKCIGQWLRNTIRVLSLMAAFGTLGWGVRSYFFNDSVTVMRRYASGNCDVRLDVNADCDDGIFNFYIHRQARVWSTNELASSYLDGIRRSENEVLRTFEWNAFPNGDHATPFPLKFNWESTYSETRDSIEESTHLVRHARFALTFPLWAVALLLSLPAAVRCMRAFRRRRVKIGHCANCGYDLRETPERCPECGTPAGAAK